MKDSKIVTVIIIILIIAIIAVLGLLTFSLYTGSIQTNSENVVNISTSNQVENKQQPIQNTEESNVVQNQTIIDPIINQITTPNTNDKTQENGSVVSSYYYSQLDENAKIIYDSLKKNKENLISGNYKIDYDTKFNTLLNSQQGEEKLNEAFQSAWDAFSYDNVDIFYIEPSKITLMNEYRSLGGIKTYKVSIGPGNNANYYLDDFKSKNDVETAKLYLENIKKQMIEQTKTDNTYNKILKVHNWLIYYISYENSSTTKVQHTIYGALKNGKAVCEGYAKTFKYLLDGIGVPCVLVSGTGTNSQGQTESHAWNYVQINGKWYAIDVTWDDPIVIGGEQTNEMRFRNFLKGSEDFFKNHKEDGKISEKGISFKFPTLSQTDYVR